MDLLKKEIAVSKITVALYIPKGNGTPVHKDRPSHGLAFNLNCESVYCFDTGERLHCHSGDLIYLPKGSNYIVEKGTANDSDGGVYAINFLIEEENCKNSPCLVKIRGVESVASMFSRAAKSWSKKGIGYYEECMSELYRVLRLLKIELNEYAPRQKNLGILAPALKYVSENYRTENISVTHLANLSGVSEPYLRRLFQRVFSVSPAIYIRNMRISYAKELLVEKGYSITEVAALSGFNDAAYFSREFKKHEGISPKDFLLDKK